MKKAGGGLNGEGYFLEDGLVERTEGKEKQDKRMEDSDGEGKLTDIQ